MKKHRRLRDVPALAWAWDATAPRVTLEGREKALIENHTGILEYTPDTLCLSCPQGVIRVEGAELTVAQAHAGSLLAEGRIFRVLLPGGELHD